MSRSQFTDVLGSIFEQTPSIAFESWNHRPFKDFDALYQSMIDILWQMSSEQQLALIRSHPDLGSRLKMAEFSVEEQAGIGLDRLSREQFEKFQDKLKSSLFGVLFVLLKEEGGFSFTTDTVFLISDFLQFLNFPFGTKV